MKDTALECYIEITNIRFRQRVNEMWTYLSEERIDKGRIDFILIRCKWINSVKYIEPYSVFQSLGFDHRVVVSKVSIIFRKTKKAIRRVYHD